MEIIKHLVREKKDLQKRLDIMEEILHSYIPIIEKDEEWVKGYFTCIIHNGKELPCNVFTRRWGWLIRLYKNIRGKNGSNSKDRKNSRNKKLI